MKEELIELVKFVKDNYEKLPKSNIDGKELVIFATGDFGGEYGYGSSDLESYGVDKNGSLFWAYASGCSCHCGAGTEEKSIKTFMVTELPEGETNIEKMLALFKDDKEKFVNSIESHSYDSY